MKLDNNKNWYKMSWLKTKISTEIKQQSLTFFITSIIKTDIERQAMCLPLKNAENKYIIKCLMIYLCDKTTIIKIKP